MMVCSVYLILNHLTRVNLIEGPEKATRGGGGVNESQSKLLTGMWTISQIKSDAPIF
jgi:hypothetical protein